MVEIGESINGVSPASTMATVVLYDAVVMLMCMDSASGL